MGAGGGGGKRTTQKNLKAYQIPFKKFGGKWKTKFAYILHYISIKKLFKLFFIQSVI